MHLEYIICENENDYERTIAKHYWFLDQVNNVVNTIRKRDPLTKSKNGIETWNKLEK